jgi:uncharacterized protein YxjI
MTLMGIDKRDKKYYNKNMQLYIKNKFFSLKGSSYALDESGRQVYWVEGKVFSLSAQKTVMDMQGNVLYVVRNKLFSPFVSTVYIYDAEENLVATLSRKLFDFRHSYIVEGYKDYITFDGSLFSLHGTMTIYRNGQPIGTVRNVLFDFVDSFLLTVDEPDDMPFLVALVIAHDNIHDKTDNNSNM